MKKLLLSVLFVVVLIPSGFSIDPGAFRFGLKASPTLSWMRSETPEYLQEGVRVGFNYGFIADVAIGSFYAFSSGININMTGGKLKYPDRISDLQTADITRTYKLQYVEIPLTIKMQTQEIGYLTYYGRFGAGLGINVRSKASDSYTSGNDVLTIDRDNIKSDTRLFKGSLIVGLGAEYSLGGRTSAVIGLTYNNGFSNVLKGTNEVIQKKPSALSNYVELTLGIMF